MNGYESIRTNSFLHSSALPLGHGAHTPAFAELVDLFPTLTDLAGVAPATAPAAATAAISLLFVHHRQKKHSPQIEGLVRNCSRFVSPARSRRSGRKALHTPACC